MGDIMHSDNEQSEKKGFEVGDILEIRGMTFKVKKWTKNGRLNLKKVGTGIEKPPKEWPDPPKEEQELPEGHVIIDTTEMEHPKYLCPTCGAGFDEMPDYGCCPFGVDHGEDVHVHSQVEINKGAEEQALSELRQQEKEPTELEVRIKEVEIDVKAEIKSVKIETYVKEDHKCPECQTILQNSPDGPWCEKCNPDAPAKFKAEEEAAYVGEQMRMAESAAQVNSKLNNEEHPPGGC